MSNRNPVDDEQEYKTIWIDCPRGKFIPIRWRRGIIGDLSSLARSGSFYFSKTQQMRFLKEYLEGSDDDITYKDLYKEIAEHLSRRPLHTIFNACSQTLES